MRLKELGEFEFIDLFCRPLGNAAWNLAGQGACGIGDDCAVIPVSESSAELVTTDLLIEGTHFLFSETDPFDLGHKTLAVNLSDIAAMGGTPKYAFLALALPPDLEISWLEQFFAGWENLSREIGVPLAGGDTTRTSANIAINVTIIGEANPRYIKYRSGALAGDVICVTDFLGDSAGGLEVILRKLPREGEEFLLKRHFLPRPHLAEGRWLAKQPAVHAMIDVSDGIDSDLRRIMAESGCGAVVDLNRLPCSDELRSFCGRHLLDPTVLAAAGGEDYCLLVTVAASELDKVKKDFYTEFKHSLYEIGKASGNLGVLQYQTNGQDKALNRHGWDSFRSS